jgi:peptide/nickel transport system substrate-binding protein
MKMTITNIRAFGLSLALAMVLGACQAGPSATPSGSQGASATPQRGGTLIASLDADPPALNPITSQVNQTFYVANQIFDTLVTYDKDFNLIPRLAKTWTISPDAKTFTFKLQSGVKWHDGKPFSSADVKFTFDVLEPTYSASAKSILDGLTSVEAPDADTVILKFSKAAAVLTSSLGDPTLAILPKHIFETGDARQNPANSAPVGTGPFKFKEWVRGDHLTLVRNENYYVPNEPYLDEVTFRVIPNAASQVAALERGEVGVIVGRVLPADAARLKANPQLRVVSPSVLARVNVLWPNLRTKPTSDPIVRKALSLAADRQRMVDQIGFGQANVARGPFGSSSVYFDSTLPPLTRNVAEANKLLDDAGYKRGADGNRFTLRLLHVATVSDFAKTAQIVKENFAEIGVNINIVAGETTTTLDAIFKNWNFDLADYTSPMGPEPAPRLSEYYSTDGINKSYFSNAEGYSNATVDQAIKDVNATLDRATRTALYKTIQRTLLNDLAGIPLWEPLFLTGSRVEFLNVFDQPDDRYVWFTKTSMRKP